MKSRLGLNHSGIRATWAASFGLALRLVGHTELSNLLSTQKDETVADRKGAATAQRCYETQPLVSPRTGQRYIAHILNMM